jgi:hypothetical protein
VRAFLKHPLVLLVLGGVFTAILVPQVTRQWQDRQREQELKQSLLEEIATASTTVLRQGIALTQACTAPERPEDARRVCARTPPPDLLRAAGGEAGEDIPQVYAALRDSWLVRRSTARARITTYFPDLYRCWYSYERALADYLSLSTQVPKAKAGRVDQLRRWVESDLVEMYGGGRAEEACVALDGLPESVQARFRKLEGDMRWGALAFKTPHPRFRAEYAKLGELLQIAGERIIVTIADADAEGFSHGLGLPGV